MNDITQFKENPLICALETFSDVYGSITEGDRGGVVLEESMEILLELSDIYILEHKDNSILLEQHGSYYSVPLVFSPKNDLEMFFNHMTTL